MAEAIDFPFSLRKLNAGDVRVNNNLLLLNYAVIRNCNNCYVFIIAKIGLRLFQADISPAL